MEYRSQRDRIVAFSAHIDTELLNILIALDASMLVFQDLGQHFIAANPVAELGSVLTAHTLAAIIARWDRQLDDGVELTITRTEAALFANAAQLIEGSFTRLQSDADPEADQLFEEALGEQIALFERDRGEPIAAVDLGSTLDAVTLPQQALEIKSKRSGTWR